MKLYQVFSKFELVNNIVFFLVSIMAEDSRVVSLDSSFPLVHQKKCNLVSNVEEGMQRPADEGSVEGLINYFIVKNILYF